MPLDHDGIDAAKITLRELALVAEELGLSGPIVPLGGLDGGAWRSGSAVLRPRPAETTSRLLQAAELARRGVPVSGPYTKGRNGVQTIRVRSWRVEAWELLEGTAGLQSRADGESAAASLGLLHAAGDLAGHERTRNPSQADDPEMSEAYRLVGGWFKRQSADWCADTLIHGDLHPGNIICRNGTAMLIDLDTLGRGPAWWDITEILVADGAHAASREAVSGLLGALELPEPPAAIVAAAGWLRRRFAVHGL